MIKVRKSAERGSADHGWLKSRHSFSFADYYDPEHMGFRSLRVINEDWIAPSQGFPSHPHRSMEIITYVMKGALEHKDSLGTSSIIRPGEVQRMSAGSLVVHSEFNPLDDQETHLLQIWILPLHRGGSPRYEQKNFLAMPVAAPLRLAVSGDGRDGSLVIDQDADLYIGRLQAGQFVDYAIRPGRGIWLQLVSGELDVNGLKLAAGDGLCVEEEQHLKFQSLSTVEFLLFDLA